MPETFTAYRAGGRSRTVQNIATDAVGVPKPGQIAYTITAATAAPTADTDGYKNLGLQKTLHCLVKNNATGGNVTIQLWGYHAAFRMGCSNCIRRYRRIWKCHSNNRCKQCRYLQSLQH